MLVFRLLLVSWALFASGCLRETVAHCRDGRMCPKDMACDEAHDGCVLPEQLDHCVDKAEAASCSYPGVKTGACYEQVCLPKLCGNGFQEEGEACDDGNLVHGDGCSADCSSNEECGNGVVDLSIGEPCEPGGDTAWCRDDCASVRCGDGVVDEDVLEQCDDGKGNSEEPNAACRPNCQRRRCGDGIQDRGEVCDDGNVESGDGCTADCTSLEECGNGVVDAAAGETCDHGGRPDAYCRDTCVSARCGDHVLDKLERCDEGAANSEAPDAACRPDCQPRRCGDFTLDSDEVCDDGNRESGDGCSYDCKSTEECRNGHRDETKGEECDDGNALSHDGCSSSCRLESVAWRKIYVGASLPPSAFISRVYDPSCGCLISIENGREVSEQHDLDLRRLPISGPAPAATHGYSLVWDGTRGEVLLFGGYDASDRPLTETWTWDGAAFRRLAPAHTPSSRSGPSMVYDSAHRRVVLHGGFVNGSARETLHDTWVWDGCDWSELHTDEGPTHGTLLYDPKRGVPVVYDDATFWRLIDDEWVGTPAEAPPWETAGYGRIQYDSARARFVYLVQSSPGSERFFTKLYEWDDTAWVPAEAGFEFNEANLGRAELYDDPSHARLVLRGEAGTYGRSDAGWSRLDHTDDALQPLALTNSAMVYDPLRGTTMLFSGQQARARSAPGTWIWNGTRFRPGPWVEPPERSYHALSYDARNRRIVLFGGEAKTPGELGDTWLWNGEAWEEAHPERSPAPRFGHGMAYDAARQQVLLFGGSNVFPSDSEPFGDTWAWDGTSWTELTTEEGPGPRQIAKLVYEPREQQVVMFAGTDLSGDDHSTWLWDDSWAALSGSSPPRTGGATLAYDGYAQKIVMCGRGDTDRNLWELSTSGADEGPLSWAEAGETALYSAWPGTDPVMVFDAVGARQLLWYSCGPPTQRVPCMFEIATRAEAERAETCRFGVDTDGDELIGCADPDCWPYCTPLCPPGAECPDDAPRCGDGECNEALETCHMCPDDCACTAVCGDYSCDAGETESKCPGDCAASLTMPRAAKCL